MGERKKKNLYNETASLRCFNWHIPDDLSRVWFEQSAQRHISGASAPIVARLRKRVRPLSSFAWRRLQGERCTGESAYSPVKPQERASWKLLVNTTGGNWHSPRRPSVWTRLSVPATLHLCFHYFKRITAISQVFHFTVAEINFIVAGCLLIRAVSVLIAIS